jgi:hypothetical protein
MESGGWDQLDELIVPAAYFFQFLSIKQDYYATCNSCNHPGGKGRDTGK